MAVVTSILRPVFIGEAAAIPLWWYIVAILGGVAILGLVVAGLAKVSIQTSITPFKLFILTTPT
jgi:predicted PurR-regulated permease PerM